MRRLLLVLTHAAALAAGFALGVYFLPVLSAPESPSPAAVQAAAQGARFQAEFQKSLKGSDMLHWGEGRVTLGPQSIAFEGRLAPGPAYRLYLVPTLVEDGAAFLAVKHQARAVGDIRTFDRFVLPLPAGERLEDHRAVVIWCEAFSQFITAAAYR